jgi:hypothetical protein
MAQPTGSVYLDALASARHRPPEPRAGRTRAILAGVCVMVGLLALSIAAIIAGLRFFVLDADSIVDVFETTLDDPQARSDLEEQVAIAIEQGLVGEELSTVAAAFELDVEAEAERIAVFVIDDAAVREELRSLVTDLHSRVLLERMPSKIDLAPFTDSVLAVIERESPRLAAIIPVDSTLWTVDSDGLPDLTEVMDQLDRALAFLLLLALLIPVGAVLHPRRHRVAAWVGRGSLVFGLTTALTAIGLPYLAGRLSGWVSVEIAVRSASLRLLGPAAVAGLTGIGLISLAAVAHRREKRRVINEGTAAAFGYEEPVAWQHDPSTERDLPTRELVDAGHPLTNI